MRPLQVWKNPQAASYDKHMYFYFLAQYFHVLVSLNSCYSGSFGNAPEGSKQDHDGYRFATISAIPTPPGFYRSPTAPESFGAWLRNIRIKKDKTVFLFNGQRKNNQSAQFAVLDIPIGNKDLQQCADAVMRLRATYLFDNKRYTDILFRDDSNKSYAFLPPYTATHFTSYLETVFAWCGSSSLNKQLRPVPLFNHITPGDVFVKGGFPGHAVIVLDVAENQNGKKVFLLAQSYMPAQDIHILKNPLHAANNPWYEVSDARQLVTPEWIFLIPGALKTW